MDGSDVLLQYKPLNPNETTIVRTLTQRSEEAGDVLQIDMSVFWTVQVTPRSVGLQGQSSQFGQS